MVVGGPPPATAHHRSGDQGAAHLVAHVQSLKLFSFGPGPEGVASIMLLLSSCSSSIVWNFGLAAL
jgi:hypothetical protein